MSDDKLAAEEMLIQATTFYTKVTTELKLVREEFDMLYKQATDWDSKFYNPMVYSKRRPNRPDNLDERITIVQSRLRELEKSSSTALLLVAKAGDRVNSFKSIDELTGDELMWAIH